MGKKAKTGKARRDKAYWSAKEIGYRSRASFKLVQLNRKFEFLQSARVCIDLCAAPGSWMQVAKEHMPANSIIVGVDLVPIKPVDGCISFTADITTDKCRSELRKELKDWKADVVLNDGAPNVGKNWIYDAYQQSLLTLGAFKLATEFLMKGGTFCTKIFRSKDYQSLLWVFNQFFKKVHSTKPAASRNESAEIFVVCLGYKAPDKIDPRFLDAKHVFSELDQLTGDAAEGDDAAEEREISNPDKRRKPAAEGYEEGATILHKTAKASEFITQDRPIHVLNNYNAIALDEPRIYKHKKTTIEVRELCKDLKVLGMKDLRVLKKWREALRGEFEAETKKIEDERAAEEAAKAGPKTEATKEEEEDAEEDADLAALDEQIAKMKDQERRIDKRLRKRSAKEKAKAIEKIKLNMVIPGGTGPVAEEHGLFQMKDLKSSRQIDDVMDMDPELLAESDVDSDDEEKKEEKTKKVSREKGKINKSGLFYTESDSEEEDTEYESDSDVDDTLGFVPEDLARVKRRQEKHEKQDAEEEALNRENEALNREENIDRLNDGEENPLLLDLDSSSREARRKKKSEMWFDRDIFKNGDAPVNGDDEDMLEADVAEAVQSIKKKGGKVLTRKEKKKKEEDSSDEEDEEDEAMDEDSEDEDFSSMKKKKLQEDKKSKKKTKKEKEAEKEFEVAPAESKKKKRKNILLTPEELAMGQEMIMSKKRKRDLMDKGWNRFMFDDKDSDLPDWFVKEEQMHMRPHKELDWKVVAAYKDQQKELNVKTIKKVVEAKARKKRKLGKKLDKAKKKAEGLIDNPDLGAREKAAEIKRMYSKAMATTKKEVTYVVAKKYTANKRTSRPKGVSGFYKQVDPRMKKDTTKKRSNATTKKMQKRRLKGKKTRPNEPQGGGGKGKGEYNG